LAARIALPMRAVKSVVVQTLKGLVVL